MRLICLLLALGCAFGQSESPGVVVSGQAVNSVTRGPVSRADVYLRPAAGGQARTTVSDTRGNFRFEQVTAGQYTLYAVADGYGSNHYGATRRGAPGRVVTVEPQKDVTGLEIAMIPPAVIRGRVIDREGEPVRGVTVAGGMLDLYGGGPVMEPIPNATDERGEFRFAGFPPGSYLIQAVPPLAGRRPSQRATASRLPTYYPSAATPESAQTVIVGPGQEAAGITITLREAPVFRITGRISGAPEGVGLSDLDLLLMPDQSQAPLGFNMTVSYARALSTRHGGSIRPDRSFELHGVERGIYTLVAAPVNPRDRGAVGRVTVMVSEQDVKDVVLPLSKPIRLTWTLRTADSNAEPPSCWFMLMSLDNDPAFLQSKQVMVEGGRAEQDGVLPGKYYLTSQCRQKDVYVKSIRLRGAVDAPDVLEGGLDLQGVSGNAQIDAVAATDSGIVTGLVRDGDIPAAGRWVALVREPAGWTRSPYSRSVSSDFDGRFTLRGVAPGEYRLYAWEQSSFSTASADPRFLKRFEAQSVKVTVRSGQQVQVEAKTVAP